MFSLILRSGNAAEAKVAQKVGLQKVVEKKTSCKGNQLSSHSKDFSYKFDPLSNGNMRTKAEWHAR